VEKEQLLKKIEQARESLQERSFFRRKRGRDQFVGEDTGPTLVELVKEAQRLGIYPPDTVEGNPNTVLQMVEGWGARWIEWEEPLSCPQCGSDWRNHETGPPFKREWHCSPREGEVVVYCPDCEDQKKTP